MTASRTISVRLTLEDADQFRTAFKAAGADGEAALKRLTSATTQANGGMQETAATGKLASYQLQQLTAETHKFADQILSGGSAIKAFVFQAPNMVSSAGGMKNALAAVTNIFTPLRLGALLAVGGITALVVAAESVDARMVKLRNSLVGYSSDYAVLAKRIEQSSREQASALNLPTGDVRSAQTAITVALPTLNDADVQKAVDLGHKLSLTLDKDLGAAMERLAGLARDPSAAIKQLADQGVAGLSAELIRNIDLMQRSGDRMGAYRLAADALNKTLGGAEMTAAQKATASLKSEFDGLWTSISEGLAGPGAALTKWLADNLKDVRERRDRGEFMPADPVIPDYMNKPLFGGSSSSAAPSAGDFSKTYGPPIGDRASARGFDSQAALALAGLESRFGQQKGGGLNNPFNLTGTPGQNTTVGVDNQNGRAYSFRNFASVGDAADAFFDKLERQYPGVKAAGRDPDKLAAALRVGEQGGYAEGVGSTVQEKRDGYAAGLRGALGKLGAPDVPVATPASTAAKQAATIERDRGRDLGAGQFGPTAPGRMDDRSYQKAAEDARSSLEGRRQNLTADIDGTQKALQEAQTRGDAGTADLLTSKLRDQRAELEKLRSPVQDYVKGLRDQSDAAKQDSGSAGEVSKALADLNRVGKDSGWQVTEADRAEVTRLTLDRLSAGYAKSQADIRRTTEATQAGAAAWLQSNNAGRELEARQKAVTEARQFFKAGSADFNAAVDAGTKAYLGQAAAAASLAAATKLASDRRDAETLSLQTDLARRGAGADESARALSALQAKQGLEGVTDEVTRSKVIGSAAALTEQRLALQQITANTNELASFADSAFDRIGSDITQAFTEGSDAATSFGNIGKAVISELGQELLKLAVINPLKNAVLGENSALPTLGGVASKLIGSSLFGGAGSGVTAGASAAGLSAGAGGLYHTGGIVGSEPTTMRMLPTALFHGAPRFHTGGIANDEVPAVLKAGEGVFTQGQMKALGANMSGAGGDGAGGNTNLHLNIDARGAGPREVDELRNQIPGLALAAVQNASQRGGRFTQQVRGGRR